MENAITEYWAGGFDKAGRNFTELPALPGDGRAHRLIDEDNDPNFATKAAVPLPNMLYRPADLNGQKGVIDPSDKQHDGSMREDCVSLARRARDAFRSACQSEDIDEAEAHYFASKGCVQELWDYAILRDEPFHDLLGLLDAAIRRAELQDFNETQRDVLRKAFADLPRWILDEEVVEKHRDRFAEHNIDILAPLVSQAKGTFRVTFERLAE